MEPNLPELPTVETSEEEQIPFNESKLKETLQENIRFFKSLLYLTKKIFML
ncbi:hypothetical protein J1D01_00140 [Seonamhaeicola sp. NFXS20]|uniref:hypothetical protein n=1 Tax=unclassified Seonamhaeicola TaxID=2622645 RepID=UPI0012FA1F46|nr:hypothetical protein [Seonamhaeicola sp. S2-3]